MRDQISTHPDEVEAYEPGSSSAKGFEEGTPQGNSLQARMQARAKELQDQITITLTLEQAEWLYDAAERGVGEWGVHPDAAQPAFDAIEVLRQKIDMVLGPGT